MRRLDLHIFVFLVFIMLLGLISPSLGQDTNAVPTKMGYTNDSLDNFKGEIKYFKFKYFPDLKYSKPQINKWVNNLEKINVIPENKKHIVVGYRNKRIIYIRLFTDPSTFTKEIYTVLKDTIKLETSGLIVSAPNYSLFIYKDDLLNKHILYMSCSTKQGKNLVFDFCPYRKEEFEYYIGTDTPKYIQTYYINKLAESERNFIIEYDKSGKQINKTTMD